ncbi:MAG: hypothetical protein U5L45_14210 [Saprospiraceae bacterium]|nr:hypothetical protein [Saprospiraceae bacterium]
MKTHLILALLFLSFLATAQPYAVKNGNTRHRFAQLEVGVTQYYTHNSGSTQVLQDGKINDYKLGGSGATAFISAYGYAENTKRSAITFEAFKFLGDYHGFKER